MRSTPIKRTIPQHHWHKQYYRNKGRFIVFGWSTVEAIDSAVQWASENNVYMKDECEWSILWRGNFCLWFRHEEDAAAFRLRFGGKIETEFPEFQDLCPEVLLP